MSFCCPFTCWSIYNVRNYWVLKHSNKFSIFSICFCKCISCSEFSLYKTYLLWCTKNILHLCRTWLCWWPEYIATIFPYFWFVYRSRTPYRRPERYHIWLLLLTLVCYHQWCCIICPIIKKSGKFFSCCHGTSIETLITTIRTESGIRRTTYWFILSESYSWLWRSNRCCISRSCWWNRRPCKTISRSCKCKRYC